MTFSIDFKHRKICRMREIARGENSALYILINRQSANKSLSRKYLYRVIVF